jgi:uncharacterized membrane protein YjgN (DUF898 family)
MPVITLTCPVCNFSKRLDISALPQPGTKVTCPNCKSVFPLEIQAESSGAETTLPPLPADGEQPASLSPIIPIQRTLTFTFTGNAQEYFGIWVVNTLLRIVTLGLYSPWAKVRKRRYFFGNTLLDGAPFDYLADPWAILKGWFIAGLFFGLYSFASRVSPLFASGFMLVFLGVFPWVVVRSRIFNLRNSTHRNIRFGFTANYSEAYRVFLWLQLLMPLSLGLMAPYVVYRQRRFLVENSSFGSTHFRFHASARDYFRIFIPIFVLIPLTAGAIAGAVLHKRLGIALALPVSLFFLSYLATILYVPTALTNLTWSSTSLGTHRFKCSLRLRDLLWLYLSNAVAVLCTLGLLAPWASVRMIKYRLDRLSATGTGCFDWVTASSDQQVGAAAEELGDMLGFDLGL